MLIRVLYTKGGNRTVREQFPFDVGSSLEKLLSWRPCFFVSNIVGEDKKYYACAQCKMLISPEGNACSYSSCFHVSFLRHFFSRVHVHAVESKCFVCVQHSGRAILQRVAKFRCP